LDIDGPGPLFLLSESIDGFTSYPRVIGEEAVNASFKVSGDLGYAIASLRQ
jgi:hypothetical protein